jgi:cyclophilin family peptidyl-prolyl cis-trans isomerase/HEAT repeat protein
VLGALLVVFASGCPRKPIAIVDGGGTDAAAPASSALTAIANAEDRRRAKDIADDLRGNHDVVVRRRAARALARIADDTSIAGSMRALEDEDGETIAWGAFGLGATCRGHEDGNVRALAARVASLVPSDATSALGDARAVIARALGKCGGEVAERTLVAWLKMTGVREAAAYALGDVASKRNRLADETTTALLDAAKGGGDPPLDAALYPFGRVDAIGDAFVERVLAIGRASLAGAPSAPSAPSARRLFAIRALARTGDLATSDLIHVVEDRAFPAAERVEAARSLGRLGRDGRSGAADALVYLVPERDPLAIAALAGEDFGVMTTLLAALGGEPPKKTEKSLAALATLTPPQGATPTPSLARRIATLRCTAAQLLSQGAYGGDVLVKCAEPGSDAFERARLAAVTLRHPMDKERRAAWLALARSKNVRVREAALGAIGAHPELDHAARVALVEALASEKAGLVATAAEQIHAHPERAYTLARSAIRDALDPNNHMEPMPMPARELDVALARALKAALAHAWTEDLVETKLALIDAGIAVGLKEARDAAVLACHDPNATMRAHAKKSLATFPDADTTCAPPDAAPDPASEIAAPAPAATMRLDTDAGPLSIRLDPSLAPIASARMLALARSGFYSGVVVHRVVPGFVVQFGDRDGDGYGGSGKLLRCETSPVAFDTLDVGVALAGRDTGSSQIFVTLARYPHLEGEYARVGHADGDWAAVAEGDVIRDVKVEE